MKRKEAAFKNMLKQATPPLEPEATWEGVRPLRKEYSCGFTVPATFYSFSHFSLVFYNHSHVNVSG